MTINASMVYENIETVCDECGRDPKSVTVVAASKKQSIEKIKEYIDYCVSRGIKPVLGENYVQEFRDKLSYLPKDIIEAHLIGPLQSNKINDAVEIFEVIESVHSLELARKLSEAALRQNKKLKIFFQVNISEDPSKSGLDAASVNNVYHEAKKYDGLEIQGLMAITKLYEDPSGARNDFQAMKKIADSLAPNLSLSMGMSDDYNYAIEEGATHVRIGTALFGDR